MMNLSDLCTYLKELLQADLFEDYGPNGLQVEGKKAIKKGAVAVSASLNVIEEAVKNKVDFLLTHHGIFWQRDPLALVGIKKEKVEQLLSHQISLLAYHLPLDAHPLFGNNWKAARDLGWQELKPFGKIGVIGHFNPMTPEAFQKKIELYYAHPAHVALGGKKEITSCALISGGAHRELVAAAQAGVDAFLTGSFDEPAWHQAFEEKIHFFALGHAATETVGLKALGEHLKEKFALDMMFIEENNPF